MIGVIRRRLGLILALLSLGAVFADAAPSRVSIPLSASVRPIATPARVTPQPAAPGSAASPNASVAPGLKDAGSRAEGTAADPGSPLSDLREAAGAAPEEAEQRTAELFDAMPRKTLLVVGVKPAHAEGIAEAAARLGVDLVVLDKPQSRRHSERLAPDARFIAAAVHERDQASMEAVARQVKDSGLKVDGVVSFVRGYAKLAGVIVDKLGVAGIPLQAVTTADEKTLTRERLNQVPELYVPFRRLESAAEARAAYRELGGGKFVIKSIRGENTMFVTLGIDSEEAAEKAYRHIDEGLKEFAKRPEAKFSMFGKHPGIMMERMLEKVPGTEEVSVELVMKDGRAAFALTSDTRNIGPQEEYPSGSLTFPSAQSDAIQQRMVRVAAMAANAAGIANGNARVDVMITPDGPKVIEVNPSMGGSNIWKVASLLTGVSLFEQGMRAVLGLPVAPGKKPDYFIDYRFMAAKTDGVLMSVEGLQDASKMPGIQHALMLVEPGDEVSGPSGSSFSEIGEVMGSGRTLAQAVANSLKALARIILRIEVRQNGDYLQPGPPKS